MLSNTIDGSDGTDHFDGIIPIQVIEICRQNIPAILPESSFHLVKNIPAILPESLTILMVKDIPANCLSLCSKPGLILLNIRPSTTVSSSLYPYPRRCLVPSLDVQLKGVQCL